MLRMLLALLALLLPSALSAQNEPAAPEAPVIVSGVVLEVGVPYPPIGDVEGYGQSISFIAWREGEEAVSTTLLWLNVNVDTAEKQAEIGAHFRRGKLVRFEAQEPVRFREKSRTAGAELANMLEPVEDAELTAAADALFRPSAFVDPELGEFEPHSRLFDHFGQVREWLGKDTVFEVILEPMGLDARDRALNMARIAWNDHKAIDETIREAITDHIYSRRAEEAGIMLVPVDGGEPIVEDELPKLSHAEFEKDHRLTRVSCSAQDYCSLQYTADKPEWHWSYTATIRRKDDGWYLDEWDFP